MAYQCSGRYLAVRSLILLHTQPSAFRMSYERSPEQRTRLAASGMGHADSCCYVHVVVKAATSPLLNTFGKMMTAANIEQV